MAEDRVDVARLYRDLDAARVGKGLTWRDLAREMALSPSTLSRLSNLKSPDVHAFMTMTQWLGVPAEQFRIGRDASEDTPSTGELPELAVELAPLLRARRDLEPDDVAYLQEIIGAAVRRFSSSRKPASE